MALVLLVWHATGMQAQAQSFPATGSTGLSLLTSEAQRPGISLPPEAGNGSPAAVTGNPSAQLPSQRQDHGAQDRALRESRPPQQAPMSADTAETSGHFQNFVKQHTGRRLPVFGANLFQNRTVFSPDMAAPAPNEYVLGPGDEVRLQIWGAVEFAGTQTLDRNGQIHLPKIGTLVLAGVQVKDLESTLRKHVSQVYTNVTLNASLGRLRSITVYVVGHAQRPGTYNLSSPASLIHAVFASGGPSHNGSMRRIALRRGNQTVTTIDLYDFMARGDKSKDSALQPGDVIVIPPVGPQVALQGASNHPGIFELRDNQETLQSVLDYSGGIGALTSPHKALVERINPQNVRAARVVQEHGLNPVDLQMRLQDGDLITLFPVDAAFSNAVTLRGHVARPLRHSHKPGMRISDLIPDTFALIQPDYHLRKNELVQYERRDGPDAPAQNKRLQHLLEEINWDYALVERLNTREVKTELLAFNLNRVLQDKNSVDNMLLQPGDIVTIFSVNDMPVPMEKRSRFVQVTGEVKVPGIYQVKPGETLAQLVARAGGLTQMAYAFGSVFTRENSRKQQQANLEKAIRRMESDLNSQSATLAQNVTDADKASATAQMATQKALADRLRQLKASGRVALEMDPHQPRFPNILLEDGDVLNVPSQPSFVAVFGSVLAETSFIWRSGSTVSDYLDKAGPTRHADLEGALLIRADGTVLANDAQRSFLGWGGNRFMSTPVHPGDSVFVPELLDRRTRYTQFIQGAKDWTQLFYQFGLGAAAVRTLSN